MGDAAQLVDIDDVDAWIEAMSRMLDDGEERQRLVDAGHVHVAGFTWQRTATETLDAYRAAAPVDGAPDDGVVT